MSASNASAPLDSLDSALPARETLAEPNADTVSDLFPTAPLAESVHQRTQIQAIDAKESELVLASPAPSHSDRTDASSACRFSRRRFWIIQGLVMSMATAASLLNSIFLPLLPVMVQLANGTCEFHSTLSVQPKSKPLYRISNFPPVRSCRITYVLSIPIAIVTTVLGYFSKNIAMFYIMRILQQIGMSAVLVAGSMNAISWPSWMVVGLTLCPSAHGCFTWPTPPLSFNVSTKAQTKSLCAVGTQRVVTSLDR
ncbi:hypothetical protein M427DRAFT_48013 [Gonapodya prolifera JEL478]|uniref:Major facilitator superfamily (MFS) profile domain-containing protein n=1 Tax=Gonapodya prolifera (strain JEL478) TaxID=1344416 RepID=A0A139A1D3_GONPJ|nr:hypothetical protein M427DRAFT_48013 [Gonapodya prolifera JEL478]|eukprot:KXS10544.1 hypothetical protein M427DRAFT_48013 [Gonapodya prolifera JEL478]